MCFGLRSARLPAMTVVVAAATILASCGHQAPPRTVSEARVPVVRVRPGAVTPRSSLGGLIVPLQNVQIQSSLTEPTLKVLVQEGQHVHRGQVLAILDTTDLRAQLQSDLGTVAGDRARAKSTYLQAGLTIAQNSNSINAAQAALTQAQQTLATDTVNMQRDAQLLTEGYVAQQTMDQQRTIVANDQQAVRTAMVSLQNAQSQVRTNGTTTSGLQGAAVAAALADEQTALGLANQIRSQIAKARIVSPIDGVVVNRNLNPGEYPGTRQIFTLQQMNPVYAVLNGSGSQVIGVRNGSVARIVSSDNATLRGTARVVAVLDQVTPGSTNFVIKAVLPNPNNVFHSGMVITGQVVHQTTKGVRIPVTAFVDDTQTTVQTLDNGTVKTLPVTLVAQDDKYAIVRGLHPGQQIIANGQLGLTDGQQAEPLARKPRTVAER